MIEGEDVEDGDVCGWDVVRETEMVE